MIKVFVYMQRRKSPVESAHTETTPNIYEASAANNQHLGNEFPLAERPNNPVNMNSVEDSPPLYMNLSNASTPPLYAIVHNNRSGNVVQSEAGAPAGDTAAGNASMEPPAVINRTTQPSAPPARGSLCHDITLIDNDLYE